MLLQLISDLALESTRISQSTAVKQSTKARRPSLKFGEVFDIICGILILPALYLFMVLTAAL